MAGTSPVASVLLSPTVQPVGRNMVLTARGSHTSDVSEPSDAQPLPKSTHIASWVTLLITAVLLTILAAYQHRRVLRATGHAQGTALLARAASPCKSSSPARLSTSDNLPSAGEEGLYPVLDPPSGQLDTLGPSPTSPTHPLPSSSSFPASFCLTSHEGAPDHEAGGYATPSHTAHIKNETDQAGLDAGTTELMQPHDQALENSSDKQNKLAQAAAAHWVSCSVNTASMLILNS